MPCFAARPQNAFVLDNIHADVPGFRAMFVEDFRFNDFQERQTEHLYLPETAPRGGLKKWSLHFGTEFVVIVMNENSV